MDPTVIIGVVAIVVTVVLASLGVAARIGRLDAKVDALSEQVASEAASRVRLLEALTLRVENLSRQFGDHAVSDAANFGELKGILGRPAQSPDPLPR